MVAEPMPRKISMWARIGGWTTRVGLWRKLAVGLAVAALISGFATYTALTGSGAIEPDPQTILILLNVDLVIALMLSAIVLRQVLQLWSERRRDYAASRLHVKLSALFSGIAVAPVIIVSVFSVLFFNLGIESWFSDKVRTVLGESMAVAEAYLNEHRQIIRADALAMANDVNRALPTLVDQPYRLDRFLQTQAVLRSLTEAMVFRRDGRVLGRSGLTFSLMLESISQSAIDDARSAEVVLVSSDNDDRVRALVRLNSVVDAYLIVGRFVDSRVIGYMERAQRAVSEYNRLEGRRSGIQITFALIFGVATWLLLLAAIWAGLAFATQIARPVSHLVVAAERVREGDLSARVEEEPVDDEIGVLSRAFNRMADQLEGQRQELIEANRQLEARRRFTESVLSGVTAGVIGLDSESRIELPNRSALTLLGAKVEDLIGHRLADAVPEMGPLIDQAMSRPARRTDDQIVITREGRTHNLLVRITDERLAGELEGFVVTFDDITALVIAQRTAAWADIARRIAHEIKNPLTPIQLAAERLRRKYMSEIKTDVEVFAACTETIIRQVGDIGRMIDEFSSFARMPAPVFKRETLNDLIGQAVTLQDIAYPDIVFVKVMPKEPIALRCDAQQVVQMLTNLLQNSVDSIEGRKPLEDGELTPGWIQIKVDESDELITIDVQDNGRGLPVDLRDRLVEPYVTTRAKGTGLGLAIVKKIMEDHGGDLALEDRADGGATVRLTFPVSKQDAEEDQREPRRVASYGA